MESEASLRESGASGVRSTDIVELPGSVAQKEKDSLMQLRNEFKAAIRDLRNDVSTAEMMMNLL
jgi:hypothetical protein